MCVCVWEGWQDWQVARWGGRRPRALGSSVCWALPKRCKFLTKKASFWLRLCSGGPWAFSGASRGARRMSRGGLRGCLRGGLRGVLKCKGFIVYVNKIVLPFEYVIASVYKRAARIKIRETHAILAMTKRTCFIVYLNKNRAAARRCYCNCL